MPLIKCQLEKINSSFKMLLYSFGVSLHRCLETYSLRFLKLMTIYNVKHVVSVLLRFMGKKIYKDRMRIIVKSPFVQNRIWRVEFAKMMFFERCNLKRNSAAQFRPENHFWKKYQGYTCHIIKQKIDSKLYKIVF